ncbi:MAG TPA: sigma factor-like helix-turn-helix DNA-binding protein [bacterium]|nr:sigma factor-like helix-turn-helix DNA-binding protein [bacterium]
MISNTSTQDNGGKNILDGIMASQYREELEEADLSKMMSKAFAGLKRKQRHVLKKRFGLVNGEVKTLQEIGDSYGVTRERIRQIEKAAIKRLGREINFKNFNPITFLVVEELEKAGGVLAEEDLIKRILGDKRHDVINANILRLLFEIHPELFFIKECDHKNVAWSLEGYDQEKMMNVLLLLHDFFEDEKEVKHIDDLHNYVSENNEIDLMHLQSLLGLSKRIMNVGDNKYGLYEWTFINPKNIRDKIYFVLNKYKKPMHFLDLTEAIGKEDFIYKKNVTHQAVHNELIADNRYVLIGKGIYALSEWGYQSGTVIDVINQIIRENGDRPLSKDEIVDQVTKRRMVKKNTIIINLHNKNYFYKTADGLFAIKNK